MAQHQGRAGRLVRFGLSGNCEGAGPTRSFDGSTPGPGGQIGPFRIERELGRGAVGVVYLAHDTKLDRPVAIKSVPAEVMDNPKARSRFSREAKLLASVNHPNIATIHEVLEEAESLGYLVLEYVPGQTLTERIAGARLKLDEVLSITLQIAEAIAAAHEHDVIHRDLKPGNIKITPEGKVKVLDFGLAKAVGGEAMDQQSTITEPGRIIGTPAYMSPEQARGKPTDKRSDIWSFGCVLYEMLTATVPFKGETISDTLANILQTEPNWQMLPQSTPANIRSLLRRCLEKDPRRRLRDIGDASIEIQETVNLPVFAPPMTTSSAGIPRLTNWKQMIMFGVVCLVLGVVMSGIVFWSRKRPVTPAGPSTSIFAITPETELADEVWWKHVLAFSPDGKFLAYVEKGTDKRRIIYVREMSKLKAKILFGTEGASSVFFSPNGEWIGYFDSFEGKLKKVPVGGGEPMVVCKCNDFRGASWRADDIIVVSSGKKDGLWSISASGNGLRQLTIPDPNRGEFTYSWPQFLPDGKRILFTIARHGGFDEYEFGVYSLETDILKILYKGSSNARYLPTTGHIVYARKETVFAVRFDLERLSLTGSHVPVIRNVKASGNYLSHFTTADNGALAYIPVPGPTTQLRPVLVTREGQAQPLSTTLRDYHSVSISPDGTKVLFDVWGGRPAGIWIYDVKQNTLVPFTSDRSGGFPIWAPDGKHIIFRSEGPLYRQKTDGSGKAELLANINVKRLTSCSPDGKQLLVTIEDPNLGNDIWVVPVEKESRQSPFPFIQKSQGQQQAVW
ncbi:MAG: serine/threonine-protein kinase, partial [Planctomycetota bacterium]